MFKVKIFLLTLVGILALILIASYIANLQFNRKVTKEVTDFFENNLRELQGINQRGEVITKEDLEGLPEPIQRWLTYSGAVGKERIIAARSKQIATMRLKKESSWMPLKADQYFTADKPGFIWKAKIDAAPLVHIVGRDKYYQGHGNMLIKAQSIFTVADAKGPEMDQGTLVRYLAETVWMPTAALGKYITWEEIDNNSAKATMTYEGVTASGVFVINDQGEVTNFLAQRYGDFEGKYRLETWTIPMKEYREFQGFKIPTKGQVVWKLKEGDFDWYHFEVLDIEYNKPVVY